MPLYSYKCVGCGDIFDVLSPTMPGKDIVTCYKCGKDAKRIMAPVNYTFGWRLSDASQGNKDELVRDI
jgi:putative FmdB family regulatory protein